MTGLLGVKQLPVAISIGATCLALGTLGACGMLFGKGPHVPTTYQGTTQLTVVNAGDRQVCVVSLFQDTRAIENWLGDKGKEQLLAPGERRVFAIKPGTYHVMGGFCDPSGQLLGAVGNYGAEATTIAGPTLIALGPKPVEPVAGAQTVTFSKFHTPPAAGAGGGGGGAEEQPAGEEPAASESSGESSSSSSSSSSSESSSSSSAPAGQSAPRDCKPLGASVNSSTECCSDATKLSPDHTKNLCCDHGTDSACS